MGATTDQLVFGRGGGQPLHGEVADGVEGQVHQVTPEVVLVEVAEEGLVGEPQDGLQEAAGGRVLHEHQQGAGGRSSWSHSEFSFLGGGASWRKAGSPHLTPGAALRLVRYSTRRLRSCLQSLGLFLWHTVSMVWNTALAAASVTLTGRGGKKREQMLTEENEETAEGSF